jgi:hypothetical protein
VINGKTDRHLMMVIRREMMVMMNDGGEVMGDG